MPYIHMVRFVFNLFGTIRIIAVNNYKHAYKNDLFVLPPRKMNSYHELLVLA